MQDGVVKVGDSEERRPAMAESRHIKQGNEQSPNQVGRSDARDTEDEMRLLKCLERPGEGSNVAAAP